MSQIDIFAGDFGWPRLRRERSGAAVLRPAGMRLLGARLMLLPPLQAIRPGAELHNPWVGGADLWPGDAAKGAGWLAAFSSQGTPGAELITQLVADPAPQVHEFGWVRDVRALGGPAAQALAQAILSAWLPRHRRWSSAVWRSDVMARRLAAWFAHWRFLVDGPAESSSGGLQDALAAAARTQLAFLHRVRGDDVTGAPRLAALASTAVATLAAAAPKPADAAGTPALRRTLQHLEREVERQVNADGGHIARAPDAQYTVVRALVDLRAALSAARAETPPWLQHAIDRATPMLRFYRHGDGGFALFNGVAAKPPAGIERVLGKAGARGRSPVSAPHTGFHRITADKTLVIVDCGAPAPRGAGAAVHAGLLSFELSLAKRRMIVNCGARPAGVDAWQQAQRSTAAHSTLVLEDSNAIPAGGRHFVVTSDLVEQNGAWLLEAEHAGYLTRFGLAHRRRLYVAEDGADIRGEDSLLVRRDTAPVSGKRFAVRFHLHPSVSVSLTGDGATALIRLPDRSGWKFQAAGCHMQIEPSIYLGDGDAPIRSEQIVLSGVTADSGAQVKWALRKVG